MIAPFMIDRMLWTWGIDHRVACREGEAILDGRNILRPETVESLFLAYRITGEQRYRDQGWRIFQAFQKHCRVRGGGYAGIADVEDGTNIEQLDKMETFWLSETLSELQWKRVLVSSVY